MKYEFLDEELDLSEFEQFGKWTNIVHQFAKSEKPSCIISCANKKERVNGLASIRAYIKKNNLNLVAGPYKGFQIYVVKHN